jgi:2-oxoglutarate ferredoxin oxidoreductase subunit beta
VTFRAEQREWKKLVRRSAISVVQDRAAATALVLADDGFSMGVLYRGDRASIGPALKPEITVADVEREFALGG